MKRTTALSFLLICLCARAAAGSEIDVLKQEYARSLEPQRSTIAVRLVKALIERGEAEQNRYDNKSARATFKEALDLIEKNNAAAPPPQLLKNLGLAELVLGDYQEALGHLLRAMAAAEKVNDREEGSSSAYLIGYIHRDLQNYDLALKYFRMAYDAAVALGNQRRIIMSLNEIGNVYAFQEQYAAALLNKERSLQLARKHGDRELLANGLQDAGNVYLAQNLALKALAYLQESLSIYRKLGQSRGIVISLINVADANRRLGRFKTALSALDEARPLAEKAGQEKDLSNVLLIYSFVYEGMKDFQRALDCLRRYQELRERLFSTDMAKQTAEMQTRYEVEKKQRENELLKQEKQISALALDKQRSQRNFLFYLALLVMLLAAVIYSRFRIKARANLKLQAANTKIVTQQGKLEEAYQQMAELARHDQLTGLPNRRVAMEEIHREEKRFQRGQKPFVLVMTDIDGFKVVNDKVGHDAGDYVLQTVAALFSNSLRAQDTVYRWGGDEFLFLLPETTMAGATVFMSATKEKVRSNEFIFNGQRLQVAASMGAYSFASGLTVEACLRSADQEMYRSRKQ